MLNNFSTIDWIKYTRNERSRILELNKLTGYLGAESRIKELIIEGILILMSSCNPLWYSYTTTHSTNIYTANSIGGLLLAIGMACGTDYGFIQGITAAFIDVSEALLTETRSGVCTTEFYLGMFCCFQNSKLLGIGIVLFAIELNS